MQPTHKSCTAPLGVNSAVFPLKQVLVHSRNPQPGSMQRSAQCCAKTFGFVQKLAWFYSMLVWGCGQQKTVLKVLNVTSTKFQAPLESL